MTLSCVLIILISPFALNGTHQLRYHHCDHSHSLWRDVLEYHRYRIFFFTLTLVLYLFPCQRFNVTLTEAVASHSTQVSGGSVTKPWDKTRKIHWISWGFLKTSDMIYSKSSVHHVIIWKTLWLASEQNEKWVTDSPFEIPAAPCGNPPCGYRPCG